MMRMSPLAFVSLRQDEPGPCVPVIDRSGTANHTNKLVASPPAAAGRKLSRGVWSYA